MLLAPLRQAAPSTAPPTLPRAAGGHYLLQSVQGIVEFPLPLQRQQPDLLPAGRELVYPRVLCFRLGDNGHAGGSGLTQGFSWKKGEKALFEVVLTGSASLSGPGKSSNEIRFIFQMENVP